MTDTARTSPLSLRRRRLLGLVGGSLAAAGATPWLVGCGGGGHDADVPGGAAEAPAGTGSAPSPSGSVEDARWAAFDAVAARQRELRASLGVPAYLQPLAAFMATLPAYVETGCDLEDGTAWGRLADGRAHLIVDNRAVGASKAVTGAAAVRSLAAAVDLPLQSKARLLHSFGSHYDGQQVVTDLASMLGDAGWGLRTGAEGDARLSTLRAIAGDGLLYFNTHGGSWGGVDRDLDSSFWSSTPPADSPKLYALTSSTRVTRETDRQPEIADDLARWRVVYCDVAMGSQDASGQDVIEKVYGITAGFVRAYWKFAPRAVALMNACHSANLGKPAVNAFIAEVQLAGVDNYLGWSRTVSPAGAYRAPRYAVDRLLGANAFEPEAEPQRPFPLDETMVDLKAKGIDLDPAKWQARFVAVPARSAAVGLLAPTLRNLQVFESSNEAHLYGQFGSDPDTVTIDGVDFRARIKDWQSTKIVVDLPTAGPGSIGAVTVTVRGVLSNTRAITQWTVPLAYDSTFAQAGPSQHCRGTGSMRFRADIGAVRDHAGQTPVRPTVIAACTADSRLVLTASGTEPIGVDCTSSWSGTIGYTGTWLIGTPLPSNALIGWLQLDTATRRADLALGLGNMPNANFQDRQCRGTYPIAFGMGALDGERSFTMPGDPGVAPVIVEKAAVVLPVGADWALPAGSRGRDDDGNFVSWEGAAAVEAPNAALAV